MKPNRRARILIMTVCTVFLGISARAGYRAWSDVNGQAVEAEYVRLAADLVVLRKRDGNEVKVPLKNLCDEDRRYVLLLNPPALDIRVNDAIDGNTIRSREGSDARVESVSIDVVLRKTSAEPYEAELSLDVIMLGRTLQLDRYVIIEHSKSTFGLTDVNKNLYEYKCGPADIRNMKGGRNQGVEYEGFVVIVRDSRGEVVSVKANRLEFEKNAGALLHANKGDAFDEDFHAVKSNERFRQRF